MISQDDIDAFSEADIDCLKTADEIVDKALKGTTRFRLIPPTDEAALVRAYAIMRDVASQAAADLLDVHQRGLESISLGEPRRKD